MEMKFKMMEIPKYDEAYLASNSNQAKDLSDEFVMTNSGLALDVNISDDEWYTYDSNPRQIVHVLAHVDEHSYDPSSEIRMGDHPVIWTNQSMKARNVYFQIGHSSKLFKTPAFCKMFENAIKWALRD